MGLFVAAAKVWHYWVGAALFIPVVLVIIATFVGYLVKVVAPRYPRQ